MSKYYIVGKEVAGKGYSAVSNGTEVSIVEAGSTKEAIANAMTTLLNGAVATNSTGLSPVMSTIYVADTVGKAISYGTVGEWLRTGKTSKGNPIKQEELVAVRDAYIALSERSFNARVVALGDIPKTDLNNRTMVQQVWSALDRHLMTIAPQQPVLGLGTVGLPAGGVTQPQMPNMGGATAGAMDMNAVMQQMAQMQQMMMQMMSGQMPQQPVSQPVSQPVMPLAGQQEPANDDILGETEGDPLGDPTVLNVDPFNMPVE